MYGIVLSVADSMLLIASIIYLIAIFSIALIYSCFLILALVDCNSILRASVRRYGEIAAPMNLNSTAFSSSKPFDPWDCVCLDTKCSLVYPHSPHTCEP